LNWNEMDAFLDAEPRVLEILGRRPQFIDEYPYLLELAIEARNSLNILVEQVVSSQLKAMCMFWRSHPTNSQWINCCHHMIQPSTFGRKA